MTSETTTTTATWPGARHARWTLKHMLRDPVRDLLAAEGRDASVVVLGCGSGELARHLLERGFGRVVAVDRRPARLDAAEAQREEFALDAEQLALSPVADIAAGSAFDFVLLESTEGCADSETDALALARRLTRRACGILTSSRLRTRELAREAGFGSISLIEPPADAERSFVLAERALLIARPAAPGGADG